ncbi:OmpA family protein [Enterovirga rhinocerotis]|uniref:Outer membrane protein OmpA-like peptidoglycan-associated protein n=1 Tax=Enterovirga rhinocerotis TaxID=1339210 RepID=A0A4R7C6P2_9HYPH|nr:OmpA family protein [Enterovirga rhinocerotis]TDR93931.1 outer membrane protein OmpA-like peptidoglycan-associated protein [Enterovirga rhinocerotis]
MFGFWQGSRVGPASIIACGLTFTAGAALAQDHPLLGHYEGSKQVGHQVASYDEATIIVGPIEEKGSTEQRGTGWQTLEGKVFTLYYRLPPGRSSLEGIRNFQQSLQQKGFEVPFVCSTEAGTCFTGNERRPGLFLGLALDGKTDLPKFDGDFVRNQFYNGNGRYLYAKRSQGGATVHVSLAIADDESRGGRAVIARVIESGEMETGKIQVKQQAEIKKDFDQSGRTTIYGILFDFDKADIKPESAPQLKEISDLMARNPGISVEVVGHTDNQGGQAYNLRLSQNRAAAVVAELTARYGVAAGRLTSRGMGMDQPVASNADEAGRALNRRVELIRR